MSPRRAVRLSAAFAALLAVTMGPKLLAGGKRLADEPQLIRDMRARMIAAGFAAHVRADDSTMVLASRGACRMILRNGDEGSIKRGIFARDAADVGPVRYGYRGRWTTAPVGLRPYLERVAQGQLAVLGIRPSRPAVLAVAQGPDCPNIDGRLDDLRVRAKSAAEPAETL